MGHVYDEASAYELAFSYRDISREVETVLAWCARHGTATPRQALELAAGPADHAVELARRGIVTTALDSNPAMCERAQRRAAAEDLPMDVVHADMTAFSIDRQFELVLLMLNSAGHLLTLDALLATLSAAADHVREGGVLVLENSHPGDFLTSTPRVNADWDMAAPDLAVHIEWGSDADPFDPISQVRQSRVRLTSERPGDSATTTEEILPERQWTATEIDAAVRLSGRWQTGGRYGSLSSPDIGLSNADEAWRVVHVLQRVGD